MAYKTKIIIIFSVFFIVLCSSIIISELDFTHCDKYGYCVDNIKKIFGQWTGLHSLSALIPIFFLVFTKAAVYNSWKFFTIIFFPIAFFGFLVTPDFCGGFFPLCFDKEFVTIFSAFLFFIISLLIIIIKSIQLRGKPEEKNNQKK